MLLLALLARLAPPHGERGKRSSLRSPSIIQMRGRRSARPVRRVTAARSPSAAATAPGLGSLATPPRLPEPGASPVSWPAPARCGRSLACCSRPCRRGQGRVLRGRGRRGRPRVRRSLGRGSVRAPTGARRCAGRSPRSPAAWVVSGFALPLLAGRSLRSLLERRLVGAATRQFFFAAVLRSAGHPGRDRRPGIARPPSLRSVILRFLLGRLRPGRPAPRSAAALSRRAPMLPCPVRLGFARVAPPAAAPALPCLFWSAASAVAGGFPRARPPDVGGRALLGLRRRRRRRRVKDPESAPATETRRGGRPPSGAAGSPPHPPFPGRRWGFRSALRGCAAPLCCLARPAFAAGRAPDPRTVPLAAWRSSLRAKVSRSRRPISDRCVPFAGSREDLRWLGIVHPSAHRRASHVT